MGFSHYGLTVIAVTLTACRGYAGAVNWHGCIVTLFFIESHWSRPHKQLPLLLLQIKSIHLAKYRVKGSTMYLSLRLALTVIVPPKIHLQNNTMVIRILFFGSLLNIAGSQGTRKSSPSELLDEILQAAGWKPPTPRLGTLTVSCCCLGNYMCSMKCCSFFCQSSCSRRVCCSIKSHLQSLPLTRGSAKSTETTPAVLPSHLKEAQRSNAGGSVWLYIAFLVNLPKQLNPFDYSPITSHCDT